MKQKITRSYISLSDEQKFDFLMFGILCDKRDYRLCMEINKKFEISLSKMDDLSVFNNKRMEDMSFSFYEYYSDEDDRFNLIGNKSARGFLLPELKQIDYLFVVRLERMPLNENAILADLKEISIVLGAYKQDIMELKSRENLVF
jgi:hypothetical protein